MTEKKPHILHKKCMICGKYFDIPRNNPRKTCSKKCEMEARRRARPWKTPPILADLTGRTFGDLTAVKYLGGGEWLWRCSCGKKVEREAREVICEGAQASCGHLRKVDALNRMGDVGASKNLAKPLRGGKIQRSYISGMSGVIMCQYENSVLYEARIVVGGKTVSLGEYITLEAAMRARLEGEQKYLQKAIKAREKETQTAIDRQKETE